MSYEKRKKEGRAREREKKEENWKLFKYFLHQAAEEDERRKRVVHQQRTSQGSSHNDKDALSLPLLYRVNKYN